MKTTLPEGQVKETSWGVDFTPSMYCRQNYLYIQCMGRYDTYSNYGTYRRKNLNSFLALHVLEGKGALEYQGEKKILSAGDMVIIDCRKEHSYYCDPESWKIQWMHFDGTCINGNFTEITQKACPIHSEKLAEEFTRIIENELGKEGKKERTNLDDLNRSTVLIQFCMGFLHEIRMSEGSGDRDLLPVIEKAIEIVFEALE